MQILGRSPQGRFPYGEEIFFRCSFRVPVHPLRKRKLSPRFEKALSRPFSNLNAVPFTPTLDPIEPKSATVPECRPKHVLTKPRSFCHARRARDESIRRGSSSSPPRAQTSRRESGALGGRPPTSRRALAVCDGRGFREECAPAERRDEHQKRVSLTTNRTTRHDAHAVNLDTRARARAAKHAANRFAQKAARRDGGGRRAAHGHLVNHGCSKSRSLKRRC